MRIALALIALLTVTTSLAIENTTTSQKKVTTTTAKEQGLDKLKNKLKTGSYFKIENKYNDKIDRAKSIKELQKIQDQMIKESYLMSEFYAEKETQLIFFYTNKDKDKLQDIKKLEDEINNTSKSNLTPEQRIEKLKKLRKDCLKQLEQKGHKIESTNKKEFAKYVLGNRELKKFLNKIDSKSDTEIDKILKEAEKIWEIEIRLKNSSEKAIAQAIIMGLDENKIMKLSDKLEEKAKKILEAESYDDAKKIEEEFNKELENLGINRKDININRIIAQEYIDAFYYKNNNIFDSYNDDIFFNLKLGGDVVNSSFLSSLTLGGTYKLKKTKIKLGGFAQYDYQTSHNISLGTSVVYDNFLGFVRYRLATYKGKINHNVDVFGKYYYEFLFNKLKVIPTASLYTTVSSRVKVKDDIYLLPRIGFDLNLGTKVSYQVLKNLNVFTEPTITVSYNNQRIKGEKDITPIDRSYFGYDINFGVEYKKKGISVKPILRLTGDMLGNVSLNTNLGIGYKF